ncbi:MAG: MoxR family ATPase [Bradymonadales bacterium]|jgi:MoxR-like ATPase
MDRSASDINAVIRQNAPLIASMKAEIAKVVVGQENMIERALIGVLAGGHILLEGVPGLAKTLLCSTLAQVIDCQFQRIQFTPDLLPADLIGTLAYRQDTGNFQVKKGPIFANLVLADEVNRAPAKVQSALLEAMQERQVTIADTSYPLPRPFMVMATQNPIDQEGTYSLPEAQLDRFMMKVVVNYPSAAEEKRILERMAEKDKPMAEKVVSAANIMSAQSVVENIYIDDRIKNYIVALVCATRDPASHKMPEMKDLVEFGASPRATISLALASKACAFMDGRSFVIPDDVQAIGYDVLRHRVSMSYEAEAENISAMDFLQNLFKSVEVP